MAAILEDKQYFWETLFKFNNVTQQLMGGIEVSNAQKVLNYILPPPFGKVCITVKPAAPLGTNFLSEALILSAVTESGESYSSFVKVSFPMSMISLMCQLTVGVVIYYLTGKISFFFFKIGTSVSSSKSDCIIYGKVLPP